VIDNDVLPDRAGPDVDTEEWTDPDDREGREQR